MIPQLLRYVTENNAMPQIPHFESALNRCSFVLSTARKHFNTYHFSYNSENANNRSAP
jgi:hypothetical protein